MSLWQEEKPESQLPPVAAMIDVQFKIICERLPVDHALALSRAVYHDVDWLHQCSHAGVHPIHVAGSQNGWERPDLDSGAELILSRRTRLTVRVDAPLAEPLQASLRGHVLKVGGFKLTVINGTPRYIKPSSTLFSRYTLFDHLSDNKEAEFVDAVIESCNNLGYSPNKILCGKSHKIKTPSGHRYARSVMLADIPIEYSQKLQDTGIGDLRAMGCGLVIPHKDTGSIQQLPEP